MPFKDECGICGRVLSYSYLRRCYRCGKLYCRDCMVPDVATGDPTRLLCLNCARRTVSPRTVSKYYGLTGYLRFRGAFTKVVKLRFARIDGIIGENLPMDAYKSETWWANAPSSPHAKGWLDAGWDVREVNLKEGYAVFHKVKDVPMKKRSRAEEIKKPFTPVRVHFPKPKTPSNTKVSKLYARIKNIERQRTSLPKLPGSFKPRPKFEKRLYKPDEKRE
ncbi:hypothetical protein MUP79_01610 [Candidatus Bathyarchaeota archaeon]|nr:hypothetical protein [Candidatus Bathyarchaeota archaeon]